MNPACASAPTSKMRVALPLAKQGIGQLQRVDHRRALLADVERRDTHRAQLGSQNGRRARQDEVRRHRREEDVVDVLGRQLRRSERALGGFEGQVRGSYTIGRVVTRDDPGSLLDPLIGGLHHAREIVVGVGFAW